MGACLKIAQIYRQSTASLNPYNPKNQASSIQIMSARATSEFISQINFPYCPWTTAGLAGSYDSRDRRHSIKTLIRIFMFDGISDCSLKIRLRNPLIDGGQQ
jgi:hypothetical protein